MEGIEWSSAEGSGLEGEDTSGAWVWPLAITLFLAFVLAVNATFIVVAVRGADPVVESYLTEER